MRLLVPAAIDRIDAGDLHRAQPGIQLSESLQRIPGRRRARPPELRAGPADLDPRLRRALHLRRARRAPVRRRHPGDDARRAGPGLALRPGLGGAHRGAARAVLGAVRQCLRRRDRRCSARRRRRDRNSARASSPAATACCARRRWLRGQWRSADASATRWMPRSCRHRRLSRPQRGRARHRPTPSCAGSSTIAHRLHAAWPTASTCRAAGSAGPDARPARRATARSASSGALQFDTRKTRATRPRPGCVSSTDLDAAQHAARHRLRRQAPDRAVPVDPGRRQANPLSAGGVIDLDRDYGGVDARWRWHVAAGRRPLDADRSASQHDALRRAARAATRTSSATSSACAARCAATRRDRVDHFDQYLQLATGSPPSAGRSTPACATARALRFDDHYITGANRDDSGRVDYTRDARRWPALLFRATRRAERSMPIAGPASRRRRSTSWPTAPTAAADSTSPCGPRPAPASKSAPRRAPRRLRIVDRAVPTPHQRRDSWSRPTSGGRSHLRRTPADRSARGLRAVAGQRAGSALARRNWPTPWLDARYRSDFLLCAARPARSRTAGAGRHAAFPACSAPVRLGPKCAGSAERRA